MQEDMRGDNFSIVTAGIIIAVSMLFGCPGWLHHDAWYTAVTHHFFHVNAFHLAVNCISLWMLFSRRRTSILFLALAYACATGSWFFTSSDAIGISNFIFATVGLRTPSLKDTWWRSPDTMIFLGLNMCMAFLPQVSGVTHIVSFSLGCITAGLIRHINTVGHDFRRAARH